jgi:hypothetical protein
MADVDEALMRRAQDVEAEGKRRFGDDPWRHYIGAIGRANPRGVDVGVVKATLAQDDPAGTFARAGREALITEASDGNSEAEEIYSKIRGEERRAYRERKGR